jgi:hypothetical protein
MPNKPGRVGPAYLFGFNSTEKFEKVRDAYQTVKVFNAIRRNS